ncbi:uncharacterized protein LOC108484058 isoform X1 [Gossypium arboreum]|uniref:Cw7 protein n=1 Tax=Gossypium arboreum TaxID=29729 RepID=A0ABR0PI68_GOSAR|nr:uncharacterized protein LOC108484058 isoform X1 [Gossypium arboreum]KAK5824020.1 hypothetical protein PVK06_018783 [Gossypium arboreum]
MLQIGEETPSRFELLSVVRKHSNLLGKTTVDEEDATDVEMDGKFWHDIFDLYFVRGKESRGRQDDDLIFFVRKWKGHSFNESEESVAPYFVRRWAPELDKLVGDSLSVVDWRRSFYLNMIAHTSYSVTVAICSHNVLRNHQVGQDTPLSAIYKVVKTVYASPSRVNFHLDSKKEVETTPAYPDICFAIDDFDSTFDAVVLTETDHCYCVLLNALDGAAFPSEKGTNDSSSSNKVPLRVDTNSMKTKNSKLTLFSGFVSYQMVRDAYDAGSSGFGSLLSMGHSSGKKDRLYMKGPGGRGEVEVAVSGVVDQSKEDSGPFSPIISKKGFGLGSIVRKAASVASVAAKNAYAVASATSSSDEEMIPLKCCLMSITLPWEHIAYDLLFKGSPPVNL